MSRPSRTLLIGVLGLLLLVSAVFVGTHSLATALPDASGVVQAEPAPAEQAPVAPQAARVKELVELRTATSKTFQLADGKREWVGYAEAVHYQDASGAFREIDDRILSEARQMDGVDYLYRNGANAYTVWFAAEAADSRFSSQKVCDIPVT